MIQDLNLYTNCAFRVTLDFLDQLEVMANLEELVCQVLLGLLVNLGKMELKEILAHLVKKVLRDQKDPWVHLDLQVIFAILFKIDIEKNYLHGHLESIENNYELKNFRIKRSNR